MNTKKVAKEIYDECKAYRNTDGRIVASRNDHGGIDVYHSDGNSVQGYSGDDAQKAFDRVVYSIQLNEIDWKKPLLKFIEEDLK